MLPLMSNLATSLLLSASTLIDPTAPKAISFDASAYVTIKNEVRVSVQKQDDAAVMVLLRDRHNEVLYRQVVGRKQASYAVKLDVSQLADGPYELEVKSSEGSIKKQLNLSTKSVKQASRIVAMQ